MPSLVREGEIFAGKYRVERILGEGGYGLVFAARNIELDQRVAVKLLKRASTDPTTAERFLREARAAQKIRGDGVARVFAVDQLDDGDLFMVMEYLEGRDLRREVVEKGALAVPDAVECILQACDVLGRAHAMGIVHRDIKSANLFSVERPDGLRQIKVLDFGIARSLNPVESSLTQAPQMMGSPLYMAPEQIVDGRTVDERTDIWGLGATMFELLAGVPPFAGGTLLQLLLRVQSHPHDDLRALRPEVPAGLERVIGMCLEKDREKRYPDVGSLVAALAPFGITASNRTEPSAPPAGLGADWSAPDTPTVARLPRPGSQPGVRPDAQPSVQPSVQPTPSMAPLRSTVVSVQDSEPHGDRRRAPEVQVVEPSGARTASPIGSLPLLVAVGAMVVVLAIVAVVMKTRGGPRAADGPEAAPSGDLVPTPVGAPWPMAAPSASVVIAATPPATAPTAPPRPSTTTPRAHGVRGGRGSSTTAPTPTGPGAPGTPMPDDRQ